MKTLFPVLILLGAVSQLSAQGIVDFDSVGWALNGDTVNGGPRIVNNTFTLTDGAGGESRSAWFGFPVFIDAFQAAFTYQDIGGGGADGIAFVVQNDPRGTNALGYESGGLAYCNTTPSVALLLNIYAGAPGGPSGFMLGTNGVGNEDLSGAYSGRTYQSTAPVNLDAGNPVNVNLRYAGALLQVTLTDTVTSSTFQTNIPVDIPAFVGSNTAWIGITGSEGSVLSHQQVTDFTFAPLPALTVSRVDASNVALTWPGGVTGFTLQSKSNLTDATWVYVSAQVNQVSGWNQAIVPSSASARFYRLVTARQPLGGGINAKGQINLSGGGSIDSFTSADPAYSTAGQYDPTKRKAHASVLTDANTAGAISVGSSKIYGSVVTGPGGTVTSGIGGSVGDISWVSNASGIQPGHAANDANILFNDLAAPFFYGTGLTPSAGIYQGTNFLYYIGSGNYNLPDGVSLSGTKRMVVTGAAVLYINGSITVSGSAFIYIAPGASLRIYLAGNGTFSGSGGGIVNGTGRAANCSVYGLPGCTVLSLSAPSTFIGTTFIGMVYAPEASLTFSGPGDAVGIFTAATVSLNGSGGFHYDESLGAAHP